MKDSEETPSLPDKPKVWVLPLLLIVAVVMILAMIRLGVWQLGRADEKQAIVSQIQNRAEQPVSQGLPEIADSLEDSRFIPVALSGEFLPQNTIYIDNQVHQGEPGYLLGTLFQIQGSSQTIMVMRGWVGVGQSRASLPTVSTPEGELTISGRLNLPPAKPPLWNDEHPTHVGALWQYLPLESYAKEVDLEVYPLVFELSEGAVGTEELRHHWLKIDDSWVAKHKAYALQWFAMAFAFTIACLILLIRRQHRMDV